MGGEAIESYPFSPDLAHHMVQEHGIIIFDGSLDMHSSHCSTVIGRNRSEGARNSADDGLRVYLVLGLPVRNSVYAPLLNPLFLKQKEA
jgi:hypothetical protein